MLPKVQVSNNSNTHIHVWLLSCNKSIIINTKTLRGNDFKSILNGTTVINRKQKFYFLSSPNLTILWRKRDNVCQRSAIFKSTRKQRLTIIYPQFLLQLQVCCLLACLDLWLSTIRQIFDPPVTLGSLQRRYQWNRFVIQLCPFIQSDKYGENRINK